MIFQLFNWFQFFDDFNFSIDLIFFNWFKFSQLTPIFQSDSNFSNDSIFSWMIPISQLI